MIGWFDNGTFDSAPVSSDAVGRLPGGSLVVDEQGSIHLAVYDSPNNTSFSVVRYLEIGSLKVQ